MLRRRARRDDFAFDSAGTTGEMSPLHELSLEAWDETLRTSLTNAFLGARHQVPALFARGLRANAILPGGTDTPMSIMITSGATPDVLKLVEGLHALKRLAAPDEIARSVLHLASDASSFITGAVLLVDGGVSINRT